MGLVIAIIPLVVLLLVLWRRHMRRLRMVERWLTSLEFNVIHVGEARLYDDPQFIHLAATGRLSYYADVVDAKGQYRRGVVLLGGALLSPRVEGTEVHWADFDAPEQSTRGFEVILRPATPTPGSPTSDEQSA